LFGIWRIITKLISHIVEDFFPQSEKSCSEIVIASLVIVVIISKVSIIILIFIIV